MSSDETGRSELSVGSYRTEVVALRWTMPDRKVPDSAYAEMLRLLTEQFPEARIELQVIKLFGSGRRLTTTVTARVARKQYLGSDLLDRGHSTAEERIVAEVIRDAYSPRFTEIVKAYRKGSPDS